MTYSSRRIKALFKKERGYDLNLSKFVDFKITKKLDQTGYNRLET